MNANFDSQNTAYLTIHPRVLSIIDHMRDHMDWSRIQLHEWALPLLLKYPDRIVWTSIESVDEWMLPIIMATPQEIRWGWFDRDVPRWMEPFFQQHLQYVFWEDFDYYEWMLPYIMQEPSEIDWDNFGFTVPDWMEPFFHSYREHITWSDIHYVPWMIEFMIRDAAELEWDYLNKHPEEWMLPLFMAHPDRVDFLIFGSVQGSYSEWMLPFFEAHPNKINWMYFDFQSRSAVEYAINNSVIDIINNPFARVSGMINYNYSLIRTARSVLHEQYYRAYYHPDRIRRWLERGFDLEQLYD